MTPVTRQWIARAFTMVEDIVYVGLGLLLGSCALILLAGGFFDFIKDLTSNAFSLRAVGLLDRILLILLVVELLYTVQVSFREHTLLPEPFLLIGLIAAVRRVLFLTAEFSQMHDHTEEAFTHFYIELLILTGLILAIAVSLILVHRHDSAKAQPG